MKIKTVSILIIILVFSWMTGCSSHRSYGVYESEFDFANKLAQHGLWKEAHYRWEKALSSRKDGKKNAAIYNNMAIAMEEQGKFDEAEKAYQKALELAPGNETIKTNYDRLKKFMKGDFPMDKKEGPKDAKKRREDGR